MLILNKLLYNYQMPSDGGGDGGDSDGGGDSGGDGGIGGMDAGAGGPAVGGTGIGGNAEATGPGSAAEFGGGSPGNDGIGGSSFGISSLSITHTVAPTPISTAYFSQQLDLTKTHQVTFGPTVTNANAMFGTPTVEHANLSNALNMAATSFSTNRFGVTTYSGVPSMFGTIDEHSIQGQMLGTEDEMAVDVLEFLGLQVTTLNIQTTEEVATLALGILTQTTPLALSLSSLEVVADLAQEVGMISATTNQGIHLAIEIVGILNRAKGYAELGGIMGFAGIGYAVLGLSELGLSGVSGFDGFGNSGGDGNGPGDINNIINSNNYIINSPIGLGIKYNNNINISTVQPTITIIHPSKIVQKGARVEVIYKEYRGGLNDVLAPHLIQQNEGQIFTNISIDNAMMTSIKEGLVGTSSNSYVYNIPGGYSFSDNYPFSIAKVGNFYYISSENISVPNISRLELNQPELTIVDLINVDITAPTFTPIANAVIPTTTYTVTASLVNIKDSTGTEETYTATVTSNYNTDINNAITNNTSVDISGTCSAGTPDGRTININVDGKIFTTVSNSGIFTVSINDLSFLSIVLDRDLWDEYNYAVTYYNEETGYESIPVFTSSCMRKTTQINLTGLVLPIASDVDSLRVYRIGGYSSVYRRIAEIANDHSGTTTTYTDDVQDVLTTGILDTTNATDIVNLKGLVEHKGSLFAFKNNQIYFSAPGKPNIWSEFNMIRVGGIVTGLASTPLGILIMSDAQQVYLFSGSDKSNFQLSSISKTIGCVDYKSVSNIRNNAIWLGYEGVMASVGSAVTNLSKGKVNVSDIGTISYSFNYDNMYYLCGSNYTLTIDFRYDKPSFKKINKVISSITFSEGVVSYVSNNTLYNDLYNKGDMLNLQYKSPKFIGAAYDLVKEFNKINLVYKGEFTYTVYIDDTVVLSEYVQSDKTAVEEINIPSDINEGLAIELELVGQGTIYSFKYLFTYLNNN